MKNELRVAVMVVLVAVLASACRRRRAVVRPMNFAAPAETRARPAGPRAAEVVDIRVGESATPVVGARLRWGPYELTLVSAPSRSPDWVSVILANRAGLRGCAEMRLEYGQAYTSAPLESFDRQGSQVRYELPLSGIVRAAAAESALIDACGQRWAVTGQYLAELRRMALLVLYRRSQTAPSLPLPSLDVPADASTSRPPLRARLPLNRAVSVTFRFDEAQADRVELLFETADVQGFRGDCNVGLEVGPAALRTTQQTVAGSDPQHMTWTIDDMHGFFALGVVDHAQLNYCEGYYDFARVASALRRFILIALLRRATTDGAPVVDLPPAERRDDPSLALPRRRAAEDGDVVSPGSLEDTEGEAAPGPI